ncbi:NAD(P)-dependent oxidoreductase [Streptosporangium amethystogenes]|uniref:NAD(P)-dependent oxidoreductase n=1 Tax=Streptosporangium amethystogenes TaxID=2002 RepID=UPI00379D4F17
MNVTVLGSTGRTGRLVLAEAVRRGHEVTAFTRRPEALPVAPAPAAVVTGDGRDPERVRKAVGGADAVIAILAAAGRKGPHHIAAVARVLADVMPEAGARRLVVTSAYPIVAEQPRVPLALLRRLFADAYADAARMEEIVSASGLDWTIVRLNRLTDRPARGGVRISRGLFDRPAPITRADAAATLLDALVDPAYARTAVNLAGGVPR